MRQFEAPLRCLDRQLPDWMVGEDLAPLRQALVIGDMRNPEALRRAGALEAQSVLLLSADSGVNLEAALQVRLLNPRARVVVRADGSRGLERHLRERLPGLALVDPELLTAGVFANALRPDGSEATFSLGEELFRVQRSQVEGSSSDDLFCLQGRRRHLLQWCPAHHPPAGGPASHWWNLNDSPRSGDQLLWLEAGRSLSSRRSSRGSWLQELATRLQLAREGLQASLQRRLRQGTPGVLVGWGLLGAVLLLGSFLFGFGSPLRGLLLTLAMLKGEYIDALSAMTEQPPMAAEQLGLAAIGLAFALGGTLLTAWLVALILDWLLTTRLGQREPKPLPAGSRYLLLIGSQRLAKRLERLLLQSRLQVVRVEAEGEGSSTPAFRSLDRALHVLRHGRCQGVAVLGTDLMANLETALGLQERWPNAQLAVQSHSPSHGTQLDRLFPRMAVINPLELAAEAVVATAYGERVREVLRVADTNLLLTDYEVEPGDTLVGRSLGEIAEGYGLVPVSLLPFGQTKAVTLPALDRILQPGDGLVVLAALPGLRAVEAGQRREPSWCLEIDGVSGRTDRFEAQMVLARYLNQAPRAVAAYLEAGSPQLTPRLHQAPARELETALRRLGVQCRLVAGKPIQASEPPAAPH
jgi:Trk K+ transport system NAD-binding subunit